MAAVLAKEGDSVPPQNALQRPFARFEEEGRDGEGPGRARGSTATEGRTRRAQLEGREGEGLRARSGRNEDAKKATRQARR